MTTNADTVSATFEPKPATPGWATRFDQLWEALGDRMNPILVKETRQALKSRQFLVTFALVLLANWVWSLWGLAINQNEINSGCGPNMLFGYYMILAFPLLLIVPYSAFRSLAVEREDGTYELLSISDLNPRQIISGKLISITTQMLIYLSATMPCLAFTYLLRGVDMPTILVMAGFLFLCSLGFSAIGLLAGTITGQRHWQVVISVLFIIALLIALLMILSYSGAVFFSQIFSVDTVGFWLGISMYVTGYLSYLVLLFYAAVAQITFDSDNRSTRLRIIMLAQQLLLLGWLGWAWGEYGPDVAPLMVAMILSPIHWYIMGAMMIGERSTLSTRVRRGLPQSFLGRTFLTWFNPGPGTGFVFAIGGMLTTFSIACLAYYSSYSTISQYGIQAIGIGYLGMCYAITYLGAGLLLSRWARRFMQAGIPITLLTQALLLAMGIIAPMVISVALDPIGAGSYSMIHIFNPFWTIVEYESSLRTFSALSEPIFVLLTLFAGAMILLNLPAIAREVRHLRIAKPKRLADEDAELHREKIVVEPQPKQISPWDEVEPS